jgi:hypothetical protein
MARWINKPLEERICKICESGDVEDENHITFHCIKYQIIRNEFYDQLLKYVPDVKNLDEMDQTKIFMSKLFVNNFAKYICKVLEIRNNILFN